MIISIASGKGGTGKTTVSTNLAAALGKKATFLDCDAEEPNAHIFLKPTRTTNREVTTFLPAIDISRCRLCRKCVEICQFNALTVVGRQLLVFPELCHGCGGCMVVCPEKAVSESSKTIGTIESGYFGKDEAPFHNGRSRISEPMVPPLIKELRKITADTRYTIIDAPPGTSCPVIAAMHGVDFVVLVTEPTPFGLHDLILAHETVKELGIPCGLVINRADLGNDHVARYAEENGLPVLLHIPFQKKIAEMYSRGGLLVEEDPAWKKEFLALLERIEFQALEQGRVQ